METTRPDKTSAGARDPEQLGGLAKGLAVIEAFSDNNERLTLSEVARLTGLSPASARRCLRTLEAMGYALVDGRYFSLAPRTLRLGYAYASSNRLPRAAQPVLDYLAEKTHESASVGVIDGPAVVFIAAAAARRSLSTGFGVGSRLPLHCCGAGRVLLAARPEAEVAARLEAMPRARLTPHTLVEPDALMREIARVRAQGYAVIDQEIELGLQSVAVPLQDASGVPIAGLSLAMRTSGMSRDEVVRELLPPLESARTKLSNWG